MKPIYFFLLIGLIFFIVEFVSPFTYNIGDEQVYFYMGHLVAEGNIPYKDFFYAHPPLQLIIYGLIFKFLPYHFHTFKVIFILLTTLNSFILFKIVKREFDDKIALISVFLLLFTSTTLYNGSYEFGLTIGLMLFLFGLYFEEKPFIQSTFFLLAGFYRFHLMFLVAGYYAYKLAIREYHYLKRGLWLLNIFVAINGFIAFVVPSYAEDVFLYHIRKPEAVVQTFDTIFSVIKSNYFLFVIPLVLTLFYFRKADLKIIKYLMISLPFIILLLFMTFFGYYFVIVIPFLAVVTAYTLTLIPKSKLIGLCTVFFVLINITNYLLLDFNIPSLDLPKGREIVGDPPTVSYFALKENRKIMGNWVDINNMLFESGLQNINYLTTDIIINKPLVIAKKDEGIYARIREFRDTLNERCLLIQEENEYLVYDCDA